MIIRPGGNREIIKVKESGILASLDPGQRRLQEALFEIVSSEVIGGAWRFGLILIVSSKASYLKSLNVLVFHFAASPQFSAGSSLLSSKDREVIFSNVLQVGTSDAGMSETCVQMSR